jgi:SAM-dependent methyltransferase
MSHDAGSFYDRYWSERDRPATEARSRDRARLSVDLLRDAGIQRGRLLDVGCGPGWALEVFSSAGYETIGVDVSEAAVEEARRRGLDARALDFEKAGAELLASSLGGPYDAVTLLEVLEHLLDPAEALEKAQGLLRPGGALVASLPNEIHVARRLSCLVGRLPFGGHCDPHVRHFDRRRSRMLFDAAGLQLRSERPVSIVPPRRRMLRALLYPAVRAFPGAFALATVYLLERRPRGQG